MWPSFAKELSSDSKICQRGWWNRNFMKDYTMAPCVIHIVILLISFLYLAVKLKKKNVSRAYILSIAFVLADQTLLRQVLHRPLHCLRRTRVWLPIGAGGRSSRKAGRMSHSHRRSRRRSRATSSVECTRWRWKDEAWSSTAARQQAFS